MSTVLFLEPLKWLIVSVIALELCYCFYCQEFFFYQHYTCEIAAIVSLEAIYPTMYFPSRHFLHHLIFFILFLNKGNTMKTNESKSRRLADTQYSCSSLYLEICFLLFFLQQSFSVVVYMGFGSKILGEFWGFRTL